MKQTQEGPTRERGRPISTPGPIGTVARAMGGMQTLATLLGCSRRTLHKAAQEGRWLEGEAGARLLAFCCQQGIATPEFPAVPDREVGRRRRRAAVQSTSPKTSAHPEPAPVPGSKRRGRHILVPGPIGQVAKALGGLDILAGILNYSVRALQVAAAQGRWIRDPEGKRLEALCRQNGVPYHRT